MRGRLRRPELQPALWIELVAAGLCLIVAVGWLVRPLQGSAPWFPVHLHSILAADYSADPHDQLQPPVQISLVLDALRDEATPSSQNSALTPAAPERFATFEARLGSPVPSVTPFPGGNAPAQPVTAPTSTHPGRPTVDAPEQPPATPLPSATMLPASPTSPPTATLPPTPTATLQPTATAQPSATVAPLPTRTHTPPTATRRPTREPTEVPPTKAPPTQPPATKPPPTRTPRPTDPPDPPDPYPEPPDPYP